MATNLVAKTANREFVDNRVNESAVEDERVSGGSVYPKPFYHSSGGVVDILSRHLKPAENRHFYPLSTFFSLKLKKEEIEKREGSLWESFEPKVDVDEQVDFDLSTLDFRDVGRFWQDALTHTRAEMRTRWPEYRGKVHDGLAGVIVGGVEASGAFREVG
jgi:hypothetical protein